MMTGIQLYNRDNISYEHLLLKAGENSTQIPDRAAMNIIF